MTSMFAPTPRRIGRGLTAVGALVVAAVLVAGVRDVTHWSPFGGHLPKLPPLTQTITSAPPPIAIVDEVRNLRQLTLQADTMTWSQTVSIRKKTLGYTYSRHNHTVTLSGIVPLSVDVSGADYTVPSPDLIVYWLPAPAAGMPAVIPASEIPYDKCSVRLPVVFLSLSQSCAANLLDYQTRAIAAFTAMAGRPVTINGARAQAGSLLACLLGPTGYGVDIQWEDQPVQSIYSPIPCTTPVSERLAPLAP